ncbi:hypothetical protein JKY72_00720, partial [Candidatus Gracilibacteria bacterium]|nr:hypothetical protein [Candidatus Gracilibacteria bacterium]
MVEDNSGKFEGGWNTRMKGVEVVSIEEFVSIRDELRNRCGFRNTELAIEAGMGRAMLENVGKEGGKGHLIGSRGIKIEKYNALKSLLDRYNAELSFFTLPSIGRSPCKGEVFRGMFDSIQERVGVTKSEIAEVMGLGASRPFLSVLFSTEKRFIDNDVLKRCWAVMCEPELYLADQIAEKERQSDERKKRRKLYMELYAELLKLVGSYSKI